MIKDKNVENLLKTSKGHIEGILKMIDENRYCVDVSKQILAVQALLKKANLKLLENHLKNCVSDAITQGKGEEKINEMMDIIDKYIK